MRFNKLSIDARLLFALLLAAFTSAPEATASPLADAEPQAIRVLLEASRSEDALLRMHAVEGAKSMPQRALPMVQLALQDENPAVRFAALVTMGRLELDSLTESAVSVAKDEDQPDFVKAAALFAASRCGEDVDLGQLAAMLWDEDPSLRSNAALLFGLSENPSALPVLLDAVDAPMDRARPVDRQIVRLQITEALFNLGHEDSLKALRGAAYSNHNEVRVMATLMLGRARDGGMEGNLIGFLAKDPVELRLAAAEALAQIGSLEGLPVMLSAAESSVATVRSQAAFALSHAATDTQAADRLARLLEDPNERVRIAAAVATLDAINP
ncbi:MAG: HEAT repeat domain-containing protein [Planctomycetota bacterium]